MLGFPLVDLEGYEMRSSFRTTALTVLAVSAGAIPGLTGAPTRSMIARPSTQQVPKDKDEIVVGVEHVVSTDSRSGPLVEPFLALNPKNSANMIAAAMVVRKSDLSRLDVAAFVTNDGGGTWTRHDFGLRYGADVWVTFQADGTAVLTTLGELANFPAGEEQLLLYRSSDNGLTWSMGPTLLGGFHDHPTLVVDSSSRQFAGSLYVVSTRGRKNALGQNRSALFTARSSNGGATFHEPAYVIPSNLSLEAHNPAINSDGALLVPFADHRRRGESRRLERQRDWLVTSTDGGKSFSEPLFISESCDGTGGWSSLAVAPSSTSFPNRIYHVCPARNFDGIQLRYSDTLGDRWSDVVRVDRPTNVTPYARTPAIAVNKDGVVGIAWYDGRGDANTVKGIFRCQEVFFAGSIDGGRTFLPDVKISREPSCPAVPENIGAALRFPAGGEYMGLVAAPDGRFHFVWADARSGTYQLYAASATVVPATTKRE